MTTKPICDMTDLELRFLLSACLSDNLHRSDIIDRSRSEEHKNLVRKNMEETEFLISRIRFELNERKQTARSNTF